MKNKKDRMSTFSSLMTIEDNLRTTRTTFGSTVVSLKTSPNHYREVPQKKEQEEEEEEELTYFNAGSKKIQLQEKIERLLGKTKRKLKLVDNDSAIKFNNRFFKDVRNLTTFVDAKQQLQRLNIFNDETILRQIMFLKESNKGQRNKEVDDQEDDERKIFEFLGNEKLYTELNQIQEEDQNHDNYLTLELIQTNHKKLMKRKNNSIIDAKEYFKSQKILQDSYQAVGGRFSADLMRNTFEKFNKRLNDLILVDQQTNRTQQSQFFQSLNKQMDTVQQVTYGTKMKKPNAQGEEDKKNNINKIMNILQKTYGIDLKHDSYLDLKGDLYQTFQKSSDKLLSSIRVNAMEEFQKYQKQQKEYAKAQANLRKLNKQELDRLIFKKQISAHNKFGLGKHLKSVSEVIQAKQELKKQQQRDQQSLQLQMSESRLEKVKQFQTLHKAKSIIKPSFRSSILQPQKKNLDFFLTPRSDTAEMNSQLSEIISSVKTAQDQFSSERKYESNKILQLNTDIDMMQQKYEIDNELRGLGFSSHDPDLILRTQIKKNMKLLQKTTRQLR